MKTGIIAILLCGGKGTRMRSDATHKVCFKINGEPSIVRTISNYRKAGVRSFCVVLGAMAGDVIECVGSLFDEVLFAYQTEALGTADATLAAVKALEASGYIGSVLVGMGDKIIAPEFVSTMVEIYQNASVDVVFATQPKRFNPHGGRVVRDATGSLLGLVEEKDVNAAAEAGENLSINGIAISPATVEQTESVNAAIYIMPFTFLSSILRTMDASCATGEYYLPDVINVACRETTEVQSDRVIEVHCDDPAQILGFNTVDELLHVEHQIRSQSEKTGIRRDTIRTASQWLSILDQNPEALRAEMTAMYGPDESFLEDRRDTYLAVLEKFANTHGADRRVVITRAPGRLNLMGRHVEHRGGDINVISINREILCVASPRDDREFHISNLLSEYNASSFVLDEYLSVLNWQEWIDFVDAGETQRLVRESDGHWENYIKAALLRLQHRYAATEIPGMDMVFSGNIPRAAGLSSSSAIVVATAEAVVKLCNIDVSPQDFVDLCGEGEWFVGSRGGAGDHAAMKFGKRGYVSQISFFPFDLKREIPFPDEYRLIIADSGVMAKKSSTARDLFNQRIAEYEYSFDLFRHAHPQQADQLARLRDINPENLSCSPSVLLDMIRAVPIALQPKEIVTILGEKYQEKFDRLSATHRVPESYRLRPVLLYGVAECLRAAHAAELLLSGDIESFGNLMHISHDGDRVSRNDTDEKVLYEPQCDDRYIDSLIVDLRSEDPERVARAQLENQPGGYACSVEETDELIDIARSVDGVVGAQLSGAGLGGCVMMLVKKTAIDELRRSLIDEFYEPRNSEPAITVCVPVAGSGALEV